MEDNKHIPAGPYNLMELAQLYGVGRHVIKNWLEPFEDIIGPKIGNYYTVKQVKVIFEKLGEPEPRY